jgi:hypothetical protein
MRDHVDRLPSLPWCDSVLTCRAHPAVLPRHSVPRITVPDEQPLSADPVESRPRCALTIGIQGERRSAGRRSPVRTFRVVIESPTKTASTDGHVDADTPGVCPGMWMIRGEPGGRASLRPRSARPRSTAARAIPPFRPAYQRNPRNGPIFIGPQPVDGFLTSLGPGRRRPGVRTPARRALVGGARRSRRVSVSPWVRRRHERHRSERPIASSSPGSCFQ